MKNTPHHRCVPTNLLRVVDIAMYPITRPIGFGPWCCWNCDRLSLFLGRVRPDMATINSDDTQPLEAEPVGNYIRSEHSLLVRRARTSRYSQKYRDGVVHRLISGNTNINQLTRELNISDRDIVDWIADVLFRKQERIDELTHLLMSVQQNPTQEQIGFYPLSFGDSEGVIDGDLKMP